MGKDDAIALGADDDLLKPPRSKDLAELAFRMVELDHERHPERTIF